MVEVWRVFRRGLALKGIGVAVQRMELGHPDPADQERACMKMEDPTRMPSERPPPLVVLEPLCTYTGLRTRT
jgi:hypothetical protein